MSNLHSIEFKRYLFEYRHEGAEWALEILARDADDARERIKRIPWAQYQGEVVSSAIMPRPRLPRIVRKFFGLS